MRGERLHLLRVVLVDGSDLAVTEIDRPAPVLGGGAHGNRPSHQATADEIAAALPLDGAMDGDGAHGIVRPIGDLRQTRGEGPQT